MPDNDEAERDRLLRLCQKFTADRVGRFMADNPDATPDQIGEATKEALESAWLMCFGEKAEFKIVKNSEPREEV